MTDEEREQVNELGRLGFPVSAVAQLLEMPEREVNAQFTAQSGEIYSAYTSGRIQGLVDIRRTIQAAALNSSSPALEKMLGFFRDSESDNMGIWED